MKILHIGKFYSPIEGGIESINRVVVEALKGNQQRIISFNNKNISVEEDVENIPVVRASSKGIFASQPLSWKYFGELRRSIKLFNPDAIHFHYPNPLGALYLLLTIDKKHKLILHWHSDVVAQKFLKPLIRPLENKLIKRANIVIATSPDYIDASDNLSKVKNKTVVIPCSIDEDKFYLNIEDNDAIKMIHNKYEQKPIIFFVGRHVDYKGISYLLEAEKAVKHDCVFIIAGQGPLTNKLKIQYNSKRIHWLGRISDNEMRQYLYAADIFAFPSITRNEAFGVALAEAMFCECPAITFTINGSGVNWVSNKSTGLEVENKNSIAFANAIDYLLENSIKREQLAKNARNRVVENFTKSAVIPKYINLYNQLFACDK